MHLRLLLIATVLAGCGGSEAANDPTPNQAGDAWKAKAEAACAKFVRIPGVPFASVTKKRDVLRQLDRLEREAAVVTAAPPGGADAEEYRRKVVEPAEHLTGTIRGAREKIRGGGSTEFAYVDVNRERGEFGEAYLGAAEDLGLSKCADELVRVDEQSAELRQSAKAICKDAPGAIKVPESRAPVGEWDALRKKLDRIIGRLEALEAPERELATWREATSGARGISREIGEMVDFVGDALRGTGDTSPERFVKFERRIDAAARRADRGFRMLGIKECADLF